MCTLYKRGNIFILTFTGDYEHWLSPSLIASLLLTHRQVKPRATRGSVLITTSQGKLFSSGFDLPWAKAAGAKAMERLYKMSESFRTVIAEMISLPMPTIAAGLLFALSHDYVFMRSDKGVLYMSEVDLGLPLADYFAAMFRSKLSDVSTWRDVLLKGVKVKGEEEVKMGIVEAAYDNEKSLVEATMRLGEQLASRKWDRKLPRNKKELIS